MGQEWIYKATDSLAPFRDTEALAVNEGFLCKAAYKRGDRKQHADLVVDVRRGDILHFYFKEKKAPPARAHLIGSFEIADHTIDPARFSWPTEHTHLVTVIDPALVARLRSLRYEDDPQLEAMTGWALRPIDVKAPTYDPEMFPARTALRRWP